MAAQPGREYAIHKANRIALTQDIAASRVDMALLVVWEGGHFRTYEIPIERAKRMLNRESYLITAEEYSYQILASSSTPMVQRLNNPIYGPPDQPTGFQYLSSAPDHNVHELDHHRRPVPYLAEGFQPYY